jgi:hypothetical protein
MSAIDLKIQRVFYWIILAMMKAKESSFGLLETNSKNTIPIRTSKDIRT